jgi:hypothetical protein
MADKRIIDFPETTSPGADYYLVTDSASDGVRKMRPTASNIGLGNVNNTSDANKPVSTAQAAAIAVVQSDVDAHEADTANPHAVTKAQVGLGNVDNTSDATKNAAVATLTNKTINGANNTLTVRLANDVTGNLPNANLATMANNTFKGNVSGSTAVPSDLTAAQVTAALPVATTSAKGLAPVLPNDATKYLDGTGNFTVPAGGGGGGSSVVQTMARVTLTSGVAVTQANVTGATSVYVTPAGHNVAMIYDGTNDVARTYSEITITLDTTNALSGKNYDVFIAYSGSVVAGYGPAWTAGAGAGSDFVRGTGAGSTEIELFNGRLVNKNAITLRNSSGTTYSIAARQATLLGGFRTVANGMTEDSVLNRVVWSVITAPRNGKVTDTTDSWTYSTPSFRQINGNTANQFTYLDGLGNTLVKAQNTNIASNASGTLFFGSYSGVGIDSTSVNSATMSAPAAVDSNATRPSVALYSGCPGLGFHKVVPLECGTAGSSLTWIGDAGTAGLFQTGMVVELSL